MSEHTKTPWSVELGEEVYICSEETQCDVTTVVNFDRTKENEANARHIVHCVNNHERLVAQLEEAKEFMEVELTGTAWADCRHMAHSIGKLLSDLGAVK